MTGHMNNAHYYLGQKMGRGDVMYWPSCFSDYCMHQKIFFFFRTADKDRDTILTLSDKTQGSHRVFEPGYPDDPDHDAPDDCAQPEQHELCGGEALVGCAVGARALGCCAGTLRRDAVIPNLSENKVRD